MSGAGAWLTTKLSGVGERADDRRRSLFVAYALLDAVQYQVDMVYLSPDAAPDDVDAFRQAARLPADKSLDGHG